MQGKIVNGYMLRRKLGEGGMAEVWYAENDIGLVAAVKVLNADLSHNEQIVERFHNEALMMVKLNHPNIRRVYGYGYLGDRHCIIMEYLEGEDLEALIKSGRHFTEEELRRWWNQSVDALNYTHAMGIVHRDIKPSNFFLDQSGDIKLLDFGIAKDTGAVSMTRTGTRMGTLMYMSPEQVRNSKDIDYRTDIYSLALTFVQLFAGKHPCADDTTDEFDIQLSIVTKPVDLSGVPAEWQGFLAPYLEKEPDKRPALRHFEAVTPVSASVKPDNISDKTIQNETGPLEDHHSGLAPLSSAPNDQPQSKKKVWPWLIAAAVLLTVIVLVFGGKSRDEKAFEACHDIVDYRQYVSQYGLDGKHYAEAKQFIADYMEDSIHQAKLKELKDVPLYNFHTDGGDGWVTNKGEVVIAPQKEFYNFMFKSCFVEDLIPVSNKDKKGFIDKLGKWVIEPKYQDVSGFCEGLASARYDGKSGFIDKSGKEVIGFKYDEVGSFSEGLAPVRIGEKWGFIDEKDNMIIDARFTDKWGGFHEGLAAVSDNRGWGYIDNAGQWVIEPKYGNAFSFSEGLAAVDYCGMKETYFIDRSGKKIIGPVDLSFNTSFSEGFCEIQSYPGHYYINKKGDKLKNSDTDCQGTCTGFCDGLAFIRHDGNCRYIDTTGKTVIQLPSDCHSGDRFEGGCARVYYLERTDLIDKTGKIVFSWNSK